MSLRPFIQLSRPKQWTKNLFVLGALFFAERLYYIHPIILAVLAFLSFCLISSAVYVFNDITDIEKDRLHPVKRNRPLAAGILSKRSAVVYGLILMVCALVLAWCVRPQVFTIVLIYFVMNNFYSLWGKHIVLVDVFIIAIGFVLRVLAGSYALPVKSSSWLLLCTLLLSLFLGLCKRRAELQLLRTNAGSHRRILNDYSEKLLDQLIGIVSASIITTYSLYTFFGLQSDHMMYTVPLVIYAIFRYLYLVYQKELGGEPANILLADKPFMVACGLWVATAFFIIYF